MRFDLSPWSRARLTSGDLARLVRRLPTDLHVSRVQLDRSRAGWGGRLIADREPVAETFDRPTPTAVLDELVRLAQARIPSLAWCSLCAGAAVIEHDGEAYCARHEQAREVTAA